MMRQHIKRIGYPLLCVALWASVVFISGCEKDQTWKNGSKAPQISVLDLHDATVKLSDFKGKVIVLRFWATGCKACVAEMPLLDVFRKKYSGNDLVVLGVNVGGSRELVEAFAKGLNISYPVLLDPAMIAANKYGVRMVPTTYFIDRNGNAKQVIPGEIPQKTFDKIVGSLL
jgi:cytochrome c biogenesis protein CcmG, thiol:disulfide interchange protein DsbE